MAVSIKKESVTSLYIDIKFSNQKRDILTSTIIDFTPIKSSEDYWVFIIQYSIVPEIKPDDVDFGVDIVLPFSITGVQELTIDDLYDCIKQTRDILQVIYNEAFHKEKTSVSIFTLEELKDDLVSALRVIQAG